MPPLPSLSLSSPIANLVVEDSFFKIFLCTSAAPARASSLVVSDGKKNCWSAVFGLNWWPNLVLLLIISTRQLPPAERSRVLPEVHSSQPAGRDSTHERGGSHQGRKAEVL